SRSAATSRSPASSRLRDWLRSSCATARRNGPARAITRRFCVSVSAFEASTSKTATTRVSDFCACWPPGPLERETCSSTSASGSTTERVTRIESPFMAAILLDVDGVLHVSGQPLPGAADAVRRLREAGHRLRFGTNATTRSKADLAARLQARGIELDLEAVQTTAATVLGKPSAAYFDAACRALDAEPSMTWMVGDDLETDVAGARGVGMRAVLVRTGKFRPDAVETSRIRPDGIVSSIASLPEWLEEHLA